MIYLVGGAVRDKLMGLSPKDMDYLVTDTSPEHMEYMGYKKVGADFPVFLHPETSNEYALARREIKTGIGYDGFSYEWEGVTVEEDLARRDLTINSMAMDSTGNVIDPFNGKSDIDNKVLRHTSKAFAEDPVRVLRVARFLARLGEEWIVAPETYALCQKIAWSEFDSLTAERVFLEMDKALSERHPWLFFEFLHMLDFHWFKELWDLKNIPQPIKHHPENCCFKHVMLCLEQGVKMEGSKEELFAILCHDFGKAPCWNERGNHHGHEEAGVPYVNAFCDRLKVPCSYRNLAVKVCEHHQRCHRALDMQPKSIHKLFVSLDCLRKPILDSFLWCNWADATGRTGLEDREYSQKDFLRECYSAVKEVDSGSIAMDCIQKGLTGQDIGGIIRIKQIDAIRGVKKKWQMS